MRLINTPAANPTANPSASTSTGLRQPALRADFKHPTLHRALNAHLGDRPGVSASFSPSPAFMRAVRRVGVDRTEVAMTIGQGARSRRWDGCVLVRDRFLGIEVELDPSGTIGIDVRRVG